MATDNTNDYSRQKRKGITIDPISSNIPSATTPVVSTTDQELADLRAHIDEINASGEQAQQEPVVIPQQQTVAPLQQPSASPEQTRKNAAVKIVRDKLAKLYAKEPDVVQEAIESHQAAGHRSKHQQFMYDLSTSSKSLAQIQVEWHAYYTSLPDDEKHEVWQEFYAANEQQTHAHKTSSAAPAHHAAHTSHSQLGTSSTAAGTRTTAELKEHILKKVSSGGKLKAKHHIQSLLFGMGIASMVVVLFLFSFFNERFLVPFMSPSKQVSATPIIGTGIEVGPEPKVVIPKINLEVPVVYDAGGTDEKSVQAALENGVVHYTTSPFPGQVGNTVIVGHSSNNILNKGKYKFAFVLLKKLEVGDTFSLHKDGVRYTYQIFEKKIVKPTDISVLGPSSKPNTATLITCDPPGTSVNRLIIVAEQISPDPNGNAPTEQKIPVLSDTGVLPSNAPSLWQRIKNIF